MKTFQVGDLVTDNVPVARTYQDIFLILSLPDDGDYQRGCAKAMLIYSTRSYIWHQLGTIYDIYVPTLIKLYAKPKMR